MLRQLRRSSWWLLWLALVLLPLRGWAYAAMQVPGPADPVAAVVVSMPCHGDDAAVEAVEAVAASHACNLCDLCHSAALPVVSPDTASRYLPPQVAVSVPLPLEAGGQFFFRPPRG